MFSWAVFPEDFLAIRADVQTIGFVPGLEVFPSASSGDTVQLWNKLFAHRVFIAEFGLNACTLTRGR
jgi:hypothetical protein